MALSIHSNPFIWRCVGRRSEMKASTGTFGWVHFPTQMRLLEESIDATNHQNRLVMYCWRLLRAVHPIILSTELILSKEQNDYRMAIWRRSTHAFIQLPRRLFLTMQEVVTFSWNTSWRVLQSVLWVHWFSQRGQHSNTSYKNEQNTSSLFLYYYTCCWSFDLFKHFPFSIFFGSRWSCKIFEWCIFLPNNPSSSSQWFFPCDCL